MGTKTQTEGYIETILHENEHGAGNGSSGYSTIELPADDPTPLTTPAEEAARAEEFPAVVQAGMWVRLIRQFYEAGLDIFRAGSVGKLLINEDGECCVRFDVFIESEAAYMDRYFHLDSELRTGDPLPDFLEQVNAPEPAFDETMKHTTAPVHPAPYSSLPDSTPLDDLDGENAEPSESETVYTTALQSTSANLEELANIYDLAADADRISLRLDDAKAVVKELREELDEANSKLRAAALALKWSREPEPELFRQRDVASEEALTGDIAGAELDAAADKLLQSPATPDESWRLISIDVLSLPGKIPEQLREHHPSLDTIGAIVDFVNTPFTYLTDVKGIGQGKAEKIADALEAFWKNRNAKPTNTPDPTSTEQGAAAFDAGQTLDDNPHPRGSSDWDDWRAGFKARGGMGDEDEAVGDEDL